MSPRTTVATDAGAEVADWRASAMCAQVDSELFFPEPDRGRRYELQVAAAKWVCARCPVRAECLEFALRALPYGVAGGLAAEERRGIPRTGEAISTAEFVGVPVRGSRSEIAAVGKAALRAGRDVESVALLCGVTRRTVKRWAAQVRDGKAAAA